MKAHALQAAMLALLSYAAVGITTFAGTGCDKYMIHDPETGLWREATREEAIADVERNILTGEHVAETVTVTVGHPEYVPIIDLVGRLAAVLAAFWLNRKYRETAGSD